MSGELNFPRIPDDEFRLRMQKFKEIMSREHIDLAVIYSNLLDPSAVRYFSDVSPINESSGLVIPAEGNPILCSGQACHEWSKYKSRIEDVRIMPEVGEVAGVEYDIEGQLDFEGLFEELKGKYNVRKIGIVGELIFPNQIYDKLGQVFPNTEKVIADALIYELRMRKSENEIACIKKAGEIMTGTLQYALGRIRPGVTELDIQADIESKMLKLGAEGYCNSFAPMIPSGSFNSNLCMNRNTLRKVKEGEIINLQAGALYEGYNATICTPVVLGKIPKEIREAVKVANEAKKILANAMKAGVQCTHLKDIYNGFLEETGYREFSPYDPIHSLGMLECESPWFMGRKDFVLVENMTVAVDIYFKGFTWGSFRIEDTYIIRKERAELATRFNEKFVGDFFK